MGQRFAKVFVGKPFGLEDEQHKDVEECLDTPIVKVERSNPLPLDLERLNDSIERFLANITVVADSLDVEETSIGLKAYLPQGRQVM